VLKPERYLNQIKNQSKFKGGQVITINRVKRKLARKKAFNPNDRQL